MFEFHFCISLCKPRTEFGKEENAYGYDWFTTSLTGARQFYHGNQIRLSTFDADKNEILRFDCCNTTDYKIILGCYAVSCPTKLIIYRPFLCHYLSTEGTSIVRFMPGIMV